MSKKMHDILPPKLAHKLEDTIKELDGGNKKNKSEHEEAKSQATKHRNKLKRFPLWEILVGGGVIVVLLCTYGFLKLPKADIQIWPNMDTLTLSEKITADKSA